METEHSLSCEGDPKEALPLFSLLFSSLPFPSFLPLLFWVAYYCRHFSDRSNLLQLNTTLHSEECLGFHTKWNRRGLIHIQAQPCLTAQAPSLGRMVRVLGPQSPIQNWDNNTYIV